MEVVGRNLQVIQEDYIKASTEITRNVDTLVQTGKPDGVMVSDESHRVIKTITKKYFEAPGGGAEAMYDPNDPTTWNTEPTKIPTQAGKTSTWTKDVHTKK
jgi:hypothetical protein